VSSGREIVPDVRDHYRRTAILKAVVREVIQRPASEVSEASLQQLLGVSGEAARRILGRLASAGLVQRLRGGMWIKRLPPELPDASSSGA
jgi:DNA-binding GntR family transcriptional regulator